jgi:hypothetical protein
MNISSDVKIYESIDLNDTSNIIYFLGKIAIIAFIIIAFLVISYIIIYSIKGIINTNTSAVLPVPPGPNIPIIPTPDIKIDRQIKNRYNKLEEIILPSSYNPYISRDHVAYRENNNKEYIANRGGCIACQVDLSDKWETKNYADTKTNIIATCAYSLDPNNKNDNIWTLDKCKSECSKLDDTK